MIINEDIGSDIDINCPCECYDSSLRLLYAPGRAVLYLAKLVLQLAVVSSSADC